MSKACLDNLKIGDLVAIKTNEVGWHSNVGEQEILYVVHSNQSYENKWGYSYPLEFILHELPEWATDADKKIQCNSLFHHSVKRVIKKP